MSTEAQRDLWLGEAREAILERLNLLFSRASQGPWRSYQDGVHPVHVGGMGSGDDYAICQGFGPKAEANQSWIAAIHNDWPMIVDIIAEARAAIATAHATA